MNQVKAVSTAAHFLDALAPSRSAGATQGADWRQSLEQALAPQRRQVERPNRETLKQAGDVKDADTSQDVEEDAIPTDDSDITAPEQETTVTQEASTESTTPTDDALPAEDEPQADEATDDEEAAAEAQAIGVTVAATPAPITTDAATASESAAVSGATPTAEGKSSPIAVLHASPSAGTSQEQADPATTHPTQPLAESTVVAEQQVDGTPAENATKIAEKQGAQAATTSAAGTSTKPGQDAQAAKPGTTPAVSSTVAQGETTVNASQQGTNAEGGDTGQQNPQDRSAGATVTLPAHASTSESSEGDDSAASSFQMEVKPAAAARALPTTTPVESATPAPAATLAPVTAADGAAGSAAAAMAAQLGLPDAGQEDTDPNVARVAQGLRGAINLKGGAVTIRLNPAELGSVRIEMQVKGNVVQASLQAQDASVRDLLTHQLGRLRDTLAGRGLTVDRLEVTSPSPMEHSNAGRDTADAQGDGRSRGQFFNQRGGSGEQGQQSRDPGAARKAFDRLLVDMVG